MELACFFVSDLHGRLTAYRRLFSAVAAERPAVVFLGGDLLPSGWFFAPAPEQSEEAADSTSCRVAETDSEDCVDDFVHGFLVPELTALRRSLGPAYPRVFLIPGNDDPLVQTATLQDEPQGLWEYMHGRHAALAEYTVFGYACVPPTPFRLKDWERYDVSRHVDVGSISPEEGLHTVPRSAHDVRYGTIRAALDELTAGADLSRAILLLHAPPYQTNLDRAALDGRMIEHTPLNVHVGSVAIRRFIEARQPLLTLHGHIHESARLTGSWQDLLGRTLCLSAAHDGPELALVRFTPEDPASATRALL